jgi:hypothetical protein
MVGMTKIFSDRFDIQKLKRGAKLEIREESISIEIRFYATSQRSKYLFSKVVRCIWEIEGRNFKSCISILNVPLSKQYCDLVM